ncbi:ss/dsDNA binding protein [Eastern grey kangaroopox virus]|uniref:Core protein VP8 n=1 Tax=Eastern grey kangaroopox virus TaxID=2042482 RepID=A0A2C9DT39_9POXV|nr:ss/dsDNA binding protein [Eastern grey kangaroopox virus]ATI21172.1 ss/dsDNA binding protein [Eastern grey kangaroopox virus]ATX75078.1 ss/dsDNA binding protein [Eastern grey kangaroopox virus]
MNPVFENLFEDEAVCAARVSREQMFQILAGAKSRFPKSLLSMYRIIPRTMTRFQMRLLTTDVVTGIVVTTVYNIKRNAGLAADTVLTMQEIERYYLSKENDVLSLMVGNTSVQDLANRKKARRAASQTVFREISSPLILLFNSKKRINVYSEDLSAETDNTYTKIGANVALLGRYGDAFLLDVHGPGTALILSAVYGLNASLDLTKLASASDLESYQSGSLGRSVDLESFAAVFDSAKKHLQLTNLDMVNE